ncbi:MAG: Dyp-type peroxidase [Nitrospira sp.]
MPNNSIDNESPIDLANPGDYEPLLRNLQGNIIKDHGRNLANHIFVTFRDEPVAMRAWLRALSGQVTSAWQQHQDKLAYVASGRTRDDIPFCSLFLTAAGYRHLQLETMMPKEIFGNSFRNGMRNSGAALQDLHFGQWDDPNWREMRAESYAVHCMILLANDNEGRLNEDTDRILRDLNGIARSMFVEKGKMFYQNRDTKRPQEHFGYVDGISNPIFLKDDLEDADGYQPDGTRWRFSHWDPFAPLSLVLVEDPGGDPNEDCFGSYLVFRKLEQNVKGFREAIKKLSTQLNPPHPSAEEQRSMALVMGRFPNGTPITVEERELPAPPFKNDFKCEAEGGRCPIRGHIRRSNPRGEIEGLENERMRRIVRRGITYGERSADFSDAPEKDRGILFMCYQGDIAKHFEHMQVEWCNWSHGIDTVVGQADSLRNLSSEAQNRNTEWPRIWAETDEDKSTQLLDWPDAKLLKGFEFGRYVTLKGGEYFFAPSISFLRRI